MSLAVPSGTLTNGSIGTIASLPGNGGARTLNALVDNLGSMTISTSTTLAGILEQRNLLTVNSPATFTVSGAMRIWSGSVTTINPGATLVKSGGCTNMGGGTIGGGGTGATCP